jgi:hypothetical protein
MNLIGNLGGPSSGDLVFNGANEILATVSSPNTSLNDRLVAVNLATGNSRYIGDLGLLEVYGLSWENGQLTAYTSDRRKLAIDPNTARVTVVGTVSSNGLIWGAATKPATASSPTDDVRQKFLYAASQYPQVGAAITGMQDQGGGVFRQEFERAIMIWNGQQVTVYETKGRSVSPTSPSPNPQPVNNINQSLIAALRTAIFGQESGYNYKAVNPNSGALGIAQVMPANIPSWSREALGYQITDNQFLNSPDLQLKIIDYKLNQYYQQAIAASGGNVDIAVRRVASAWYSGNPNLYNNTTPQYTNGVQYPSIANYTLSVLGKFQQAYDGGSSNNSNNSNNSGGSVGSVGNVQVGATPIDDTFRFNEAVKFMYSEMMHNPFNFFLYMENLNLPNSPLNKLALWNQMVDNGHRWDHKSILVEKLYLKGTNYSFEFPGDQDYEYFYDIWSNVHYGYVGRAIGIPREILQGFSIANDVWSDIKGLKIPRIFDGPDYNAVAIGMDLWDSGQTLENLTEDKLRQAILDNRDKLNRRKLPQSSPNTPSTNQTSGSSSGYNT